jgi:stage II sporulation protein D
MYRLDVPRLEIIVKNNAFYARNKSNGALKRIKTDTLLFRSKHPIRVTNREYNGIIILQICPKEKKVYLINRLDLEDYVYSVLLAESYPTWPDEMQQIQAIVSRTYAVHQMLAQKKRKHRKPYDIKRNTFHQRYDGNHNYYHLRRAVNETKGLILTYKNNVVLTMFDACCGGSIPAQMRGPNFKVAPYLARTFPCHYCKNYSLYRWKRKLPVQTFLNYLYRYKPIASKLDPKNKTLFSIVNNKTGKSGIVNTVKIQQTEKKYSFISGKDLWMSMPNIIRSQNFVLTKKNQTIFIQGKGFGHQIGLCQRGARELVRRKWSLKKILTFYYPKTTLAKLRTDTNARV